MRSDRKTLVVIPAYDEESSVAQVIKGTLRLGLPCLVVDDGSNDETGSVARSAGASVMTLPTNLGVGAALRAGFRYAVANGFDRVVQIDADMQHDPASIPLLLEKADRGVDLVIASRFGSQYDAGARRPAMRLLSWIVSRSTGVRIDDPTSGFKVVTEPLLSEFAHSFPAEYLGDTVEAIIRASALGARISQVEVPMSKRVTGLPTSAAKAAAHFGRVLMAMSTGKSNRSPE